MNTVVSVLIGGAIGWAANPVMGTGDREGLAVNIVIGIVGAVLGGWLLSSLVDAAIFNRAILAASGLAVSSIGAVTLLVAAKLARLA